MTTDIDIENTPLHEQNQHLLAELAELDQQLDAKRRELEKLGSRVTNLELDVQRRDAVIERLRAERPGEPPALAAESTRREWHAEEERWRALYETEFARANRLIEDHKRLEEQLVRVTQERDNLAASAAPASASHPGSAPCSLPHVERRRLPDDRQGRTYKLRIGTKEELCEACGAPLPGSRVSGHVTVNSYPDGRPGELFLSLDRARRGDLAATMGHQLAIAISIALQHGVPLEAFTSRMRHVRDESGGTVMRDDGDGRVVPAENPRTVGSLVDLVAATLERHAKGGQP